MKETQTFCQKFCDGRVTLEIKKDSFDYHKNTFFIKAETGPSNQKAIDKSLDNLPSYTNKNRLVCSVSNYSQFFFSSKISWEDAAAEAYLKLTAWLEEAETKWREREEKIKKAAGVPHTLTDMKAAAVKFRMQETETT